MEEAYMMLVLVLMFLAFYGYIVHLLELPMDDDNWHEL
jgi:hypothetical protein